MSGPAPKSTAALKLSGSWRADKRGDDPTYAPSPAKAPTSLKGAALAEWKRVAPLMLAANTLRDVDRTTLVAYCEAVADLQLATVELAKDVKAFGYSHAIRGGLVSAKNKARADVLKCAAALGITPASATRVLVQPKPVGLASFARQRVACRDRSAPSTGTND